MFIRVLQQSPRDDAGAVRRARDAQDSSGRGRVADQDSGVGTGVVVPLSSVGAAERNFHRVGAQTVGGHSRAGRRGATDAPGTIFSDVVRFDTFDVRI